MDLDTILKKTKAKSLQVTKAIKPVLIATSDRPYDLKSEPKKSKEYSKYRQKNKNKTDNKPITNWEQTDNKPITNWEQSGNKVGAKLGTELVTKWEQTDNKPITNTPFSTLIGLQKIMIVFLYKECKKNRSKFTESLTLEYIADRVKTTQGTVKMTIKRLEMKGCIIRKEFKNGRGGWTKYELQDYMFQEVLQLESDNKLGTNWEQTGNKVGAELGTEPITNPLSSSSYNNTTTRETEVSLDLPEGWGGIEFESLCEIGFTKTQIHQLANKNLNTPEIVQESINHFAFGLANNKKFKEYSEPLNVLMGVLRKGGHWCEPNYESPQDKILREILAEKKQRKEKRDVMLKELTDLEFPQWEENLSEEEFKAIVPEATRKTKLRGAIKSALRVYFVKSVIMPRLERKADREANRHI